MEATEKRTKESAEYNVKNMTFMAGGILRTLTLPTPVEDDQKSLNSRKLMLIGARNVLIDSVANMTKKTGFSDAQRTEHMGKVLIALNEGKEPERAKTPGVALSTFAMAGLSAALTDEENMEQLLAAKQVAKSGLVPNFKKLTAQQLVREAELRARLGM